MKSRLEAPSPHAFCLFSSASRPLGVDLEVVAEIAPSGRLVRLPLCPRQVLGLWTYRGKIVPIIGLGSHQEELSSASAKHDKAFLILKSRQGPWGLMIDRNGVQVEVSPPLQWSEGFSLPGGFIALGEVDSGGVVHTILDHDRTWIGLKSEIDRWYGLVLDRHRLESPSVSHLERVNAH